MVLSTGVGGWPSALAFPVLLALGEQMLPHKTAEALT